MFIYLFLFFSEVSRSVRQLSVSNEENKWPPFGSLNFYILYIYAHVAIYAKKNFTFYKQVHALNILKISSATFLMQNTELWLEVPYFPFQLRAFVLLPLLRGID